MASYSVQYIFMLVDRFTPKSGVMVSAANKIRSAMAAAGGTMTGFMRTAGLAAAAIGVLGAAFVLSGVKQAAAFEDALAGVRRVTDITRSEMLEYGKDALRIGVATAQSGEQVAEIMKQGAMMGLRGRETLGSFAEVVSKIAVAWDDISTEQASSQLARLSAKFFGDQGPAQQAESIRDVSDSINELSNRSAFKAPELLKYFDRGAAAAKRFGLTAQQAAAYGGAALVLGEPTGELQGTRARMTFQRLINATTAATKTKKGLTKLGTSFKLLGINQKQFTNLVNNDPQRLLVKLAETMGAMDKPTAQRVADGLFDARSSAQFLSIAQNVNEYKRQLAIADDVWAKELTGDKAFMDWLRNSGEGNKELADQLDRYGRIASRAGSVQREFAKRTETLSFAWKQLGLAFDRVKIGAAMPLLEPLRHMTNWAADVLSSLGDVVERNPDLFSNLFKGLSTAAVVGAGYGLLQLTAWMTGAASAAAVLKGLGLISLKFAVVAVGIATAYWIYDNWAKLKEMAADPIKFSVLFPDAPEWLKGLMNSVGDKGDRDSGQFDRVQRWLNNAPASNEFIGGVVSQEAARRAIEQTAAAARGMRGDPFAQFPMANMPEQTFANKLSGWNPTWGTYDVHGSPAAGSPQPYFNAASIPQSLSVNVQSHTGFDPATVNVNVNVTGTVNGPVNGSGTGSGTLNARPSRGTATSEAGSGAPQGGFYGP